MRRILVSHTDLDGIGSIVLADYFNLPFDDIYSWDYGFGELPECVDILKQADEIIVADISLPEELHKELLQQGKHIETYDHHETAEWLNSIEGNIMDTERCGTKLFFEEYCIPRIGRYKPAVREFVELVNAYDLWLLDSPIRDHSEHLQRVWSAYADWGCKDNMMRHERFVRAMTKKLKALDHFSWNTTELSFIEKALKKEEIAYQSCLKCLQTRTDNRGKKFGIWKAWGKISIVASRILNVEKMDYDYLICLQDSLNNWGKTSARSIEEVFNVTELALINGHFAAGGGTLTAEEANLLWEQDYCLKYNDEWAEGETFIEKCRN